RATSASRAAVCPRPERGSRIVSTSACGAARGTAASSGGPSRGRGGRSSRPGSPRVRRSRRAGGESGDDLLEDARVGVDAGKTRLRARGGLLGQLARPFGPLRRGIAVAVEDVVDDLEEQAQLVAER